MKFIHPQQDNWRALGGEDGPHVTITPAPNLLLTLAQWHAVRSQWPASLPVAVSVPNDTDIETLGEDLPRIAVVVLNFPKWVDGRAYSQARLLRSRYRYTGEVRATGEALVDMLPLMARTGFDAVQLRSDQGLEAAQRALKFFPSFYQGDVQATQPVFGRAA